MIEQELATVVRAYELAQRNRIATAAHVRATRAARAGREGEPSVTGAEATELDALLAAELLTERRLCRQMEAVVMRHPAWPWLDQVRGIGPTLSARLLARLRIERAPTPSSFWSFCGLSTVAAVRYRCAACGVIMDFSAEATAPRRHHTALGASCEGSLTADSSCGARVAVRLPSRGRPRTFDVSARTLCHVIGVSFLRRGRAYRRVYDERRSRLSAERAGWSANRIHLTAMRTMEKLFLAHLWLVWAEARGIPSRSPYAAMTGRAPACLISPWEMVDG